MNPVKSWIVLAGLVMIVSLPATAKKWVIEKDAWRGTNGAKPGTPAGDLNQVKEDLARNRLKSASAAIEAWLEKHPDDPHTSEALFVAARISYARTRWHDAFTRLEELADHYPGSRFFAPAMQLEFDIADKYLRGHKRRLWGMRIINAQDDGIEILLRIQERMPESDLAQRALMRLADYHHSRKEWRLAEDSFQLLVRNYPRSPRREEAMLASAQCALNRYRGPAYDVTCLLDAQDRFGQFQRQYPVAAEREHVGEILARIQDHQAENYALIADYYRRTQRPGAAKIYRKAFANRWPNSKWTEELESSQ